MNQKEEEELRLGAQGRKTGKEKSEFLKLKTLKFLKRGGRGGGGRANRGRDREPSRCDTHPVQGHPEKNIKDIKQAVDSDFYSQQKNPTELEIVHSSCWWLTRNIIPTNNITFNGSYGFV